MPSPDRSIGVFSLFTIERPAWTVEEAATALGVSTSSTHRYFSALLDAGFLSTETAGRYVLGPAFILYDRQIQLTDPLLQAARPVMSDLAAYAPDGTTVVLCRVFGETVLCVHQVLGRGPQPLVSYERGRPMPLFRGATSTIILAHLPARQLQRLYHDHTAEIADAGLGDDLETFRNMLGSLRRAGHAIVWHQVDAGRAGIAAPILEQGKKVLGSLSFVVTESEVDEKQASRLALMVKDAAREIERALGDISEAPLAAAR